MMSRLEDVRKMMKNEFENLIHGSVTDEEYELIETVYM